MLTMLVRKNVLCALSGAYKPWVEWFISYLVMPNFTLAGHILTDNLLSTKVIGMNVLL